MTKENKGLIFDIQEEVNINESGVKIIIYLKGCALNCLWCSNPEGQKKKQESLNIENYNSDNIKLSSKYLTAEELFSNIREKAKTPNIQITISGGEPLVQPDFVNELVKLCVKNNISIELETAGYFGWEKVKKFIENFDHIYYDLKILDSFLHKQLTGKENKIILKNLKKLSKINPDKITLTIPVIRSINSSPEMFEEIAKLCLKLKIKKARLLPYQTNGIKKYQELGRFYTLPFAVAPSQTELESLLTILKKSGIACSIIQ